MLPQNTEYTNLNKAPVAGDTGPYSLTLPDNRRIFDIAIIGKTGAGQDMGEGIGDIELYIGTNKQITISGPELDELNSLYDANHGVINDGDGQEYILPLLFAQWYRKRPVDADNFALDIPAGLTARLDVNFLAAANAPTLKFRASEQKLPRIAQAQRNLDQAGNPTLLKIFRQNLNTGSDEVNWENLTRKDRYQFLRFYNPSDATITALEVTMNGETIHKLTKAQNDALLIRHGMNPVPGIYDLIPDFTDNVGDWLNGFEIAEIKFKITLSASTNNVIKLLTGRWGSPE